MIVEVARVEAPSMRYGRAPKVALTIAALGVVAMVLFHAHTPGRAVGEAVARSEARAVEQPTVIVAASSASTRLIVLEPDEVRAEPPALEARDEPAAAAAPATVTRKSSRAGARAKKRPAKATRPSSPSPSPPLDLIRSRTATQQRLRAACGRLVDGTEVFSVVHEVSGGRVVRIELVDRTYTPAEACVERTLNERIRQSWPTADPDVRKEYKYSVERSEG